MTICVCLDCGKSEYAEDMIDVPSCKLSYHNSVCWDCFQNLEDEEDL